MAPVNSTPRTLEHRLAARSSPQPNGCVVWTGAKSEGEGMKIVRWPCQLGAAITLPTPAGPVVFVKSLPMSERLRKHEEAHVKQIERMGAVRYIATHIVARIVTRDCYAKSHPIEKEAYDAEAV